MADRYQRYKVVYRDRTERVLFDTSADIRRQAAFYEPTNGKVVKVEPVNR